ncbi:hypothetical protein [Streptomyces sp. NEAU-W12]|uniref:hypothetical protein n=1 Tax=Streptomyces sp. NEAU-W12 TaxID=2994668 RepID=UPI00224B650E|nr:hypothetical protein [Streptomyces sp. NEAU-W12]MCX2923014.1 hypothetical protein [Streptomyces sp. NEAU-W12]
MNVTEKLADFVELATRTGLEDIFTPGLTTVRGAFGAASGEPAGAGGESVSVESLSFAEPAGAEWCMCISALLDAPTAA